MVSEGLTVERRRQKSLAILQRIRKAPVAVVAKEVLASTQALPRACWGVWLQQFEECKKFGTQVKYAAQAHRNGSRNLWELFFGLAANPEMYNLQQSFSYFARGLRYWRDKGQRYQGGLWWTSLLTGLRGLGFRRAQAGFEHGAVGRITWPPPPVVAEFTEWLACGRRLLREAFRRQQFRAFLDKGRRDSRQLRGAAKYEEERVTRARTLYRTTRHAGRAVLLGAAWHWSTLCYSRAGGLASDMPLVLAAWHHRLGV